MILLIINCLEAPVNNAIIPQQPRTFLSKLKAGILPKWLVTGIDKTPLWGDDNNLDHSAKIILTFTRFLNFLCFNINLGVDLNTMTNVAVNNDDNIQSLPWIHIFFIIWTMAESISYQYRYAIFVVAVAISVIVQTYMVYMYNTLLANEQIVKYGLDVNVIPPLKDATKITPETIAQYIQRALMLSPGRANCLMRDIWAAKTMHNGCILIEGVIGSGKEKTAALIASVGGGGVSISLAEFALMGTDNAREKFTAIKEYCLKHNRFLIIKDAELLLENNNQFPYVQKSSPAIQYKHLNSRQLKHQQAIRTTMAQLINGIISDTGMNTAPTTNGNGLRVILINTSNIVRKVNIPFLRRIKCTINLNDIVELPMLIYGAIVENGIQISGFTPESAADYLVPHFLKQSRANISMANVSNLFYALSTETHATLLPIDYIIAQIPKFVASSLTDQEICSTIYHRRMSKLRADVNNPEDQGEIIRLNPELLKSPTPV
jgi:hypothetical protein